MTEINELYCDGEELNFVLSDVEDDRLYINKSIDYNYYPVIRISPCVINNIPSWRCCIKYTDYNDNAVIVVDEFYDVALNKCIKEWNKKNK